MASPPKPWEGDTANTAAGDDSAQLGGNLSTQGPTVPSREGGDAAPGTTGIDGVTGTTTNPMGMGGMNSMGYGSSYGTGYGMGGYGSSYGMGSYGMGGYGMGGYGMGSYGMGSYGMGGYGMGGYGMGGYGMGGYGMGPNDPNNPQSLTQRLDASTRSTFALIQSVVGAFGGFARMLESTYFATHSSFMAVLGVMDQFGLLRNYMGKAVGSTMAFDGFRRLWARLKGKPMDVNKDELSPEGFNEFNKRSGIRKRTLLLFLAIIIGVPYLMTRMIRAMVNRQRRLASERLIMQSQSMDQNQAPNAMSQAGYEFAHALYDFQGESKAELSFKKGDVIAVLNKTNVWGRPSEWWRGKLQNGTEGLFPSNYVRIISSTNQAHTPTQQQSPNMQPQLPRLAPKVTITPEEFKKVEDQI